MKKLLDFLTNPKYLFVAGLLAFPTGIFAALYYNVNAGTYFEFPLHLWFLPMDYLMIAGPVLFVRGIYNWLFKGTKY